MFLKITANINRIILLPGNAVRSALSCPALAPSAYASGDNLLRCVQNYLDDNAEHLNCYDQLAISESVLAPEPPKNVIPDKRAVSDTTHAAVPSLSTDRSCLTRVWNLDNRSSLDPSQSGGLQPYRQNYLLVTKTGSPNHQPSSPLIDHNVTTPNDIDAVETKFQLSFKAVYYGESLIDYNHSQNTIGLGFSFWEW